MKPSYRKLTRPGEGLAKLLGDLEREIMEIMWHREQGSVRDVLVELNARRPAGQQLAYTTVMTVMARLAEKGLLRRTLVGKAHAYEVAESREAFLARASRELAHQLIEDFGEAAIDGFLQELRRVAPDRLAKLRQQAQRHGKA